jgi:hypothetical protein
MSERERGRSCASPAESRSAICAGRSELDAPTELQFARGLRCRRLAEEGRLHISYIGQETGAIGDIEGVNGQRKDWTFATLPALQNVILGPAQGFATLWILIAAMPN